MVNPVTYTLHLPATLGIHPTFHVSLLRKYIPGVHQTPPPLPKIIDEHPEWEVERILRHAIKGRGRRKVTYYLIRWKGYTSEYDTWEPASNLRNSPELLNEYRDYCQDHRPNKRAKT